MQFHKIHVSESAASSASTTILSEKVPYGHDFKVLHFSAVDLTSVVATSIRLGMFDGQRYYQLDGSPGAFAAGSSNYVPTEFVVPAGWQLYATFNNATEADILELLAVGLLYVHEV